MRERKHQRVLFLEPKSTHLHVYSAVHIPRIGSLLLATLLRERGYDVEVIVEDMLRRRVREADVWQRIREADLLCISTITSTVQRCYMWGDRARLAGIPVVMGGTHVSYFPDEAMAHADFVMRGECDESFPLFMETLESGGDLGRVPGLTWRDGGAIRHNPDAPLPGSAVLEANPFPDYGLVWQADVRGGVGSFAAARGCPFDCSFCSVTKFNGSRLRAMSAERTLDMIEEHWRRYRPHYAFFAEDIFNLVKPRAKAILRGLIERRIRPRIGFGAQMRHEVVKDPEFLQLMRAAGFDRAMVGFESINQASLDLCGKRQKVEEVEHAIREFHRHGIKVHGMFVAGFDTDEPRTFRDTLNFVKRLHLDSFQLMLLTPLPGSRDWVTEGYADGSRPLLTREWRNFDGHHAVQVPKLMTAYEANLLALKTMKQFYTLPRAVGRLLKGDWVEFTMRLTGYHI
ncbi:MAG: B12-binding domain-containing radical SAM protein, partial [Candidatus Sumerlaeaceae bacterium]|nr:B12-binding domain-containing radical SAM protein [Candidatus Sumerlaeaceae bacterium]